MKKLAKLFIFCVCALLNISCGSATEEQIDIVMESEKSDDIITESFNIGKTEVNIDSVDKGILTVNINSEKDIKIIVSGNNTEYIHEIGDLKEVSLPLQESGSYMITVMENTNVENYIKIYEASLDIEIDNELDPWLQSNMYCEWNTDTKAYSIASSFKDEDCTVVINKVFDYIVLNITYDTVLAENVKSGYIPDPDRTIDKRSGICYDYASLTAAMLRSNGIPCKIVVGYVGHDLYHAWNEVWIEGAGWVMVDWDMYRGWNRADLTFLASGNSVDYIKNDKNYRSLYYY